MIFSTKTLRSKSGSAITEVGPAIFLIFMFAFFPMLDLMFLGFSYCACLSLNNLQVAEAAKTPAIEAMSDEGIVKKMIPDNWSQTGIGRFVGLVSQPSTQLEYKDGPENVYGNDYYVLVTTTATVRPFLAIPFLPGVPGLNQPVTFNISGRKLVENPRFVNLGGD